MLYFLQLNVARNRSFLALVNKLLEQGCATEQGHSIVAGDVQYTWRGRMWWARRQSSEYTHRYFTAKYMHPTQWLDQDGRCTFSRENCSGTDCTRCREPWML